MVWKGHNSLFIWILALKNLWIFSKKCHVKPYYFLVNNDTLESDHSLYFKCNLLERKWKLSKQLIVMLQVKKLQYDINREAEKISTLS